MSLREPPTRRWGRLARTEAKDPRLLLSLGIRARPQALGAADAERETCLPAGRGAAAAVSEGWPSFLSPDFVPSLSLNNTALRSSPGLGGITEA